MLAEILARHEPGYERDPTKKIQLLNHLAALKDKRVPPLLPPYLADMDEGVRYAAVEALIRQGDEAAPRRRSSSSSRSPRKRACASACRSPRGSPSSAGRSRPTSATPC